MIFRFLFNLQGKNSDVFNGEHLIQQALFSSQDFIEVVLSIAMEIQRCFCLFVCVLFCNERVFDI